jgi:DNA-binding CsgD family transcriptional regulator
MTESLSLTPREQEIADLLADYMSQAEVAKHLEISLRTVEEHAASLRRKTGSKTTRQAVSRARRRGRGPR